MGRFWAATRVVALFLTALCVHPLALACEACERVPLAAENSSERTIGRVDVTAAVDTATSFIVDNTLRSWRWLSHWGVTQTEVDITQLDQPDAVADISNGSDVNATVSDYVAAYDTTESPQAAHLPSFRREHKWALTYRSDAGDAISQPAQSDRFPGMNTTLDDSVVVGLRFEWEYGWTR
jgi:hypothetical protein